jgi:hypothetical protein
VSGVRHSDGEVNVESGTGFSSTTGKTTPVVQLTVVGQGAKTAVIQLLPEEARAIGLDLIAAASLAIADTTFRRAARERGVDGDELVGRLRATTREWLGEG